MVVGLPRALEVTQDLVKGGVLGCAGWTDEVMPVSKEWGHGSTNPGKQMRKRERERDAENQFRPRWDGEAKAL